MFQSYGSQYLGRNKVNRDCLPQVKMFIDRLVSMEHTHRVRNSRFAQRVNLKQLWQHLDPRQDGFVEAGDWAKFLCVADAQLLVGRLNHGKGCPRVTLSEFLAQFS